MLNEIIEKRRSIRAFSNETLTDAQINVLFEAAKKAPSSMNEQPWNFIFAERNDKENFDKMLKILNETNRIWAQNSALLVLSVAKMNFDFNGKENKYAYHDVALAEANLIFQATSMNLYSHVMGGFNPSLAKEIFEIPDGYEPVAAIAIGYKGDTENLPENLQLRENSVSTRKEISEFVFTGKFGEGILER